MGKRGNCFVAVKKAFSPKPKEKKEKKEKKSSKSKKRWRFRNRKRKDTSSSLDAILAAAATPPHRTQSGDLKLAEAEKELLEKSSKSKKRWRFRNRKRKDTPSSVDAILAAAAAAAPPHRTQSGDLKLAEAEKEQSKHAYSVALATAAAAEVAVAAAHAAVEIVRLTAVPRYRGRSPEEVAAIKIQTAFRGYLARRALRALRGLVRLKKLIDGDSVKRQASTTLRCMQTLARVQSQIRKRRNRMSEHNEAVQRQLQLKNEKHLESLKVSMGDNWDYGIQSKEQTEARILKKQDAAARRERALAYAYSHQQAGRNARAENQNFMDPNNPQWGWSWLERWMAARPWESGSTTEKEQNDNSSVKSSSHSVGEGSITKAYARKVDKPSKPTRQSPTLTPRAAKPKSASPKVDIWTADDDARSTISMQSDRHRRQSVAGSSVRDDESMASSTSVPSYMTSTASVKAKARLQSPMGTEKVETPDRVSSAASAKKRLPFQASPAAPRRHSGPPRVDSSLTKGTSK